MPLLVHLYSQTSPIARNVSDYVSWLIDNQELTRLAHRSVQHSTGNAIEQMVVPRLWRFELSQGKYIDPDYSIWCERRSISHCYPVWDKPQSICIGDGIKRKNCCTVRHDRFEKISWCSQSDIWPKGHVTESERSIIWLRRTVTNFPASVLSRLKF